MLDNGKGVYVKRAILFLSPSLKNGGAEHMISFVSQVCASRGFECFLYIVGCGTNEVPYDERITVYTSKFVGNQKKLMLKRAREVSNIIIDNRIGLLCAFTPHPTKIAVLANIKHHLPLIASERDNPYAWGILRKKINNYFYNRCSCVVFQVNGALDAFRGKTKRNGIVIPNPSLDDVTGKVASESNTIILAGGSLTVRKNFSLLIDAFSIFHNKYENYTLMIYGEGEDREKLEKQIRDLNLENNISLPGWKKAFVKLHKEDAFCFVLSSSNEGMPNVLIEAMANGIPCISTDTQPGGPRYLLDNGRNGLLVPVGDCQALADAMICMVENETQRHQMANQAFARIRELSRTEIEKKWMDCFNEWGKKNE